MNTTQVMNVCLPALLLAGSALLAAEPAPDPRTTRMPIYTLPASAAADGRLGEWAGVPPVPAERFGIEPYNASPRPATRPAPENFAPMLRCGMKPGSPDLFFLIVVQDAQRYTEQMAYWVEGDRVELFLDFGRQARDEQHPNWRKLTGKDRDRFFNPPGMGQFALGPQTLAVAAQARTAYDAAKWKYDYACVPVEGGAAYELRLDGQSVLDALGAKALPERAGFHLTLDDQDYPVVLRTEGWNNSGDRAWLFTHDRMVFRWTDGYGLLSLRPQPAGAGAAVPLPKTLPELFGPDPAAALSKLGNGTLPAGRLADLIYWAGCRGVQFTPALVKALMSVRSALVRENCLAVLCYTKQPKDAAQAACAAAYAETDAALLSPNVLILANLVNEKYALGFAPEVMALVAHPDLNVAISAARALAKIGTAGDIAPLEQAIAARITDLKGSATIPAMQRTGLVRAVEVFMGPALDALKLRVEPITIPTATPVVTVKAENTDLPRLMPLDNNHVYNARGLLRAWPKEGPKELWRVEIGEGKSAVTEVGGRAFTAAQFDGKQWALCLNPATGATLWKHEIYPKEWKHITNGPVVTPLVDGNRVYVSPKMDVAYNPLSPVYCLNAEDGAEIWRSDDNEYFGQNDGTPLIVDDTLYIPAGKSGKGKILVAVDKLTGKLRWSVSDPQKRDWSYGSAASPAYQILDGIPQIICGVYGGAKEAWGVSAKTGEFFWSYPTPMHHSLISSPVATGSRVILCGGQGSAAFSACLQMFVRDGKLCARQLYRSEKNQVNMYHTVAVLGGAVYGFSGKSLQCTRLEDGRVLWEQTGGDWGLDQTLIVADGLIFALTKKGDLVLIEANQTGYQELGRVATRIKLGIPQQPTLANGRLYIRGDTTIICYDLLNAGARADAGQKIPAAKDGGSPVPKQAPSATSLIPDGAAAHWPGFRGPGGLATAGAGKAASLAADIGRVAWKTELSHHGNGSPIVWGERVFVTGADKKLGVIYCFKTDTGEQVWRREVPLTGPADPMEETGYATPTPATDGKRVYAIFATGDVVAFDLDGKPAWQAKLGEYKAPYGYASSPVLYRDRLLVQYDQQDDGDSALLALDTRTGRTAWRIKRSMGPSWSTPLVISTRRGPQVIVCANNGIAAYAPEDGREIWTVRCETQDLVPVPTVAGGLIIAAMTGAGTLAVSPDGDGDVTKTHVVWHNEDAVSDVPSPVGFGDLFFQLFAGKLTCHKAADGKEVGALEFEGNFYASPILCGGALLLLDRDGAMAAVKAGPALEKIGARAVGKAANASPVLAGGRLFVRLDKALVCIAPGAP
jgi:outer membrane protein assembly factor BamB